jgi:hypothetical protein
MHLRLTKLTLCTCDSQTAIKLKGLFDPEDETTKTVTNVSNCLPVDTA